MNFNSNNLYDENLYYQNHDYKNLKLQNILEHLFVTNMDSPLQIKKYRSF